MTVLTDPSHIKVDDRRHRGEQAGRRTTVPAHGEWRPAVDRPDPVDLLTAQDAVRDQDLVPVRHGRMMVSPFTFYRGSAKVMAADLAGTPTAGLDVQLCGDAHLSNFGGFASPERHLLFGLNDFDETLPGPFEYDVKRMAASFTIAARNNGFGQSDTTAVTREAVKAYRTAMAEFAEMRLLDVWYSRTSEQDIQEAIRAAQNGASPNGAKHGKDKGKKRKDKGKKKGDGKAAKSGPAKDADAARAARTANKTMQKAHGRDSLRSLARYAEVVDGRYRIVSEPPVVVPQREMGGYGGLTAEQIGSVVEDQFRAYKASLTDDRRALLERFTIVDVARKVVGVGSVGTRAFMVLLEGRDTGDPLFLQVKEATRSVLEDHLPRTRFSTPGQRVVEGQRIMQATPDIFLGWTTGLQDDRYFYWRQLADMKGSAVIEAMTPLGMGFYARMCGLALARAHARSGDPAAIADHLGTGDRFDRAIAEFSAQYAEQNSRDYDRFVEAVKDGRIAAVEGV